MEMQEWPASRLPNPEGAVTLVPWAVSPRAAAVRAAALPQRAPREVGSRNIVRWLPECEIHQSTPTAMQVL